MKPQKRCNHRTCRTLIDYDKRYCSKHKGTSHQRYDASRDERSKDLYHSMEWKNLRKQALMRDDWICQMCLQKGNITKADIVHHIVEVRDDWSKRLDIENLSSVCRKCHNKIHAKTD